MFILRNKMTGNYFITFDNSDPKGPWAVITTANRKHAKILLSEPSCRSVEKDLVNKAQQNPNHWQREA